jgi:hypothetical protein
MGHSAQFVFVVLPFQPHTDIPFSLATVSLSVPYCIRNVASLPKPASVRGRLMNKQSNAQPHVRSIGYVALIFAMFFEIEVVLTKSAGKFVKIFDFSTSVGSFGRIAKAGDYWGTRGIGSRGGSFLFFPLLSHFRRQFALVTVKKGSKFVIPSGCSLSVY